MNLPRPLQPDGRLHGVVIAARREDKRWLCIRRSKTVSAAPLKVCFPGGAIEVGESQEAAVVREMQEELGALIHPNQCVWRWDQPNGNLTLWGWKADLLSFDLQPNPEEVAEVLWLTSAQISAHPDALPNNRAFVARLEEA
jgi:8-oxo-dGTP diphosphatase